ncbi:MAG: FN3 associated domain-containing protein [bacterium]|nr:FN3 associated domain-containing protein [bacterium]
MKNKFKFVLLGLLMILLLQFTGVTANATEATQSKTGLQPPTLSMATEAQSSNLFQGKRSSYYNSPWEKYSSYYYYNKMNANERAVYDQLNSMCLYYLDNPGNFSNSTTPYVSYSGLKAQNVYNVALIFFYSNPQYFYLQPGFSIYYYTKGSIDQCKGRIAIYVYDTFKTGSKRVTAANNLKKAIDTYVPLIQKEDGLQNKVQKAHDLITEMTIYKASTYDQSAYSTFIEHKTVCAGYAAAFSILCNAVGIDTTVVTSNSHAWNNIRLNDSWYTMDCTWDDLDGKSYDGKNSYQRWYLFFNRSNAFLEKNDQDAAHVPASYWNGYLALCTLDSKATYTSCGTIETPSKTVQAPVITVKNGNNKNTVTITSSTPNTTIYYTLNGTDPSASASKCYQYTGPLTLTKSSTIKAIAIHNTLYDSKVSTVAQKVILYHAFQPSIASQPASKTYAYGDTPKALSVKSTVSDGGTLSYQWYKNTSNKAGEGTAIKNATKSSYTPSTSTLGTTYYYCVITNHNARATITKTSVKTSTVAKIVVTKKKVKSLKITGIKSKTYTSKAIKQSIKVKNGSKTLKEKKDYKISYKNNKKIGTATITVTGLKNYTGSRSYTFTITPKQNKVKASAAYRKIKLSWKKDAQANGYTIQYSTNKKFISVYTAKVTKNSTTKGYITNLKSKHQYYIRVRSYKKVGKKTIYGPWSKTVSVKTK